LDVHSEPSTRAGRACQEKNALKKKLAKILLESVKAGATRQGISVFPVSLKQWAAMAKKS
jgi:hypothetical protein